VSGGAASCLVLAVVYPWDTWQTQCHAGLPLTAWRSSYVGFWVAALGLVAHRGLYFMFSDLAAAAVPTPRPRVSLALRFSVTSVAGLLTFPLDTVRRRMIIAPAMAYGGAVDCVCSVVASEGVGALWAGFGWSVARGLVGAAAMSAGGMVRARYTRRKQQAI